MGYGGREDPAKFGPTIQRAREAEGQRHPCPTPFFSGHRANQLVAEFAKFSTMQATELAETDLTTYNEYLFLQSAILEAQPIQDEVSQEMNKRDAEAKAAAAKAAKRQRGARD